LKSGAIDIIHAHNGRTTLAGVLAVKMARRGSCVSTQHFSRRPTPSARGWKGRLSHAVHAWIARGLAHTIAISGAARDSALARGDVEASKISVVLNGVAAPVPDAHSSREQKRSTWGAGEEDFLIACVARLEEEKSIDTLLEALALVRPTVPRASWSSRPGRAAGALRLWLKSSIWATRCRCRASCPARRT
jgi:glycosyltransferase involved in cell wall biosynthesis